MSLLLLCVGNAIRARERRGERDLNERYRRARERERESVTERSGSSVAQQTSLPPSRSSRIYINAVHVTGWHTVLRPRPSAETITTITNGNYYFDFDRTNRNSIRLRPATDTTQKKTHIWPSAFSIIFLNVLGNVSNMPLSFIRPVSPTSVNLLICR